MTSAGTTFHFRFDETLVEARPEWSVGAALAASGVLELRRTERGEPRGLHCGMGACWDCLVFIDGRAVRACQTAARPGLVVGSAPALGVPPAPTVPIVVRPQVLVVGGGPAGLSAALAAAGAGAPVMLLDERAVPGGAYFKPSVASEDSQAREGDRLRRRVAASGVRVVTGATVWGAFPPDQRQDSVGVHANDDAVAEIAAITDDAAHLIRPRRLILATGAHERPVAIPGWTLPGVMTSGGMQVLLRSMRVPPGRSLVVAGTGPLNLHLAVTALRLGLHVTAVVETAPAPDAGALRAALALVWHAPELAWQGAGLLATLRRGSVPVLWGARLLACEGAERFAALRVLHRGRELRLAAECCALHHGLVPETALARALGARHRVGASGVLETETDAVGRTSLPGVFAVGDGAASGGARVAMARGHLAGLVAADVDAAARPDGRAATQALRRARAFQDALWRIFAAPSLPAPADDAIVCRCESISAAILRSLPDGTRWPAAKRLTRAGMGRCGGRFCTATAMAILDQRGAGPPALQDFAAPRAPVRPIPAGRLMIPAVDRGHHHGIADPPFPAWQTDAAAPTPRDCEVLVIGAGVVGLSCAIDLAAAGVDVLVVDRGAPGLGASTTNAGSLHVQLLAYDYDGTGDPGPLARALSLGPRAIARWQEIAAETHDDLGLRLGGGLILAEDEATLAWLRAKTAFERAEGIEAWVLDRSELVQLVPLLAADFVGAAWCPQEGQMDPLRGTAAVLRLARAAGARMASGLAINGLARERTGFSVSTPSGAFRAGRVVNAAGPHAAAVGAMLGQLLPMRTIVQQVVVTEPAPPLLTPLLQWARRHLSLKQTASGHLLIGGGWPGRMEADGAARLLRWAVQGNLHTAGQVLPAIADLNVLRAWAAPNILLDNGPILGVLPGEPDLFHAVTSNGWTLGPLVGRNVAEQVLAARRACGRAT